MSSTNAIDRTINTHDTARTRNHERYRLAQKQSIIGAWLLKIFQQKVTEDDDSYVINQDELIHMYIVMQLNPEMFSGLFEEAIAYGGFIVLIAQCILMTVIEIPLFFMAIFLGSYGRKGSINMWECVPLFKGMGYSVTSLMVIIQTLSSLKAGLSLLYMYNMLTPVIPWRNCDFKEADKDCIPMYTPNVSKCNHDHIASTNYFEGKTYHHTIHQWKFLGGAMAGDWAIFVLITWLLVFVCVASNFKRFAGFFRTVHRFIILVFLVMFVATLFVSFQYHSYVVLNTGLQVFLDPQIWVDMLLRASQPNTPGTIVYMSSISAADVCLTTVIIKVFAIKAIFILAAVIFFSTCLKITLNVYNIPDITCVSISRTGTLFSVIVDGFAYLTIPHIWIIAWLFMMFFLSLTTMVYGLSASINSFLQAYPRFNKSRICFCILLILICAVCSLLPLSPRGKTFVKGWITGAYPLAVAILFLVYTITICYIYSTEELQNDHIFMYKTKIVVYWIYMWKFSPIMFLFAFIAMLSRGYPVIPDTDENIRNLMEIMGYVGASMLVCPVAAVMLYLYLKSLRKNEKRINLFKAAETWGPLDEEIKKRRRNYNPAMDMNCKTDTMKCKHHCLLGSPRFIKESLSQRTYYLKLLEDMGHNKHS